jgi:Bacterial Ig domain
VITAGATVKGPRGVAVDPAAGRVYWANFSSSAISYAKLNGTGGADLSTGTATLNQPAGVALDPLSGRIYWANEFSPLSFVNLDGSAGTDLATPYTSGGNEFPALLEAPVGAGAPTITGGKATGSVLLCSRGAWGEDLTGALLYRAPQSFAYQWSLNGSDIAGATSSSYTASTPGAYTCRVTGSNPAGSATQTSATQTVVTPPSCAPLSTTASAGQPTIVFLSCRDPSGAAVTYLLDSSPAQGALSAFNSATGKVTYTPAAGYSGRDSFKYHATSANGTASSQTVAIAVTARRQPPTISHARLTNKRFRVASQATAISAGRIPLGTSFHFALSAAARLKITITRSATGLRSGHRCLTPSPKLRRAHARRCTRKLTSGTLVRATEPTGSDSLRFSGRLGRHALKPGSYRALLVASNLDGASQPVALTFTVVR